MSEETMSGCITHKDTRHIRLYYDYLDIYKNNEHKAKIIRILETWTDTKRAAWYKEAVEQKEQGQPIEEPDFWITMSHQQFRHFMHETVSLDTIKANLVELTKLKHIERRVNPDNPYGSPQYKLNCAAIQKAINKLAAVAFIPEVPDLSEEETPPEVSPPPGKTTPPPGVTLPPTQGGELSPPPQEKPPLPQGGKTATSNNNSNTKITTKENNKERGSEKPHQSSPPSLDQKVANVYGTFDALFQEVLKTPDFFCLRTDKSEQDAIRGLLDCKATSARLRDVFMDMWNQQDKDGKFFWRDHMSIKNVCKQYSQRFASIQNKNLQKEKPKQSSPPSPPESSAIPTVPFKPQSRSLAAAARR